MSAPIANLFRTEAVRHHTMGQKADGDVLRLSPAWIARTYWVVVAAVVVMVGFVVLAPNPQWAAGPAFVRCSGRTILPAKSPGTVGAVEVRPGERVTKGQLLVRFDDAAERAELTRIRDNIETQLVAYLRDPNNESAARAVGTLETERTFAESRLRERTVRAPRAGRISDVRVRPGQHVQPGDIILSVIHEDAAYSIEALLPGEDRPMLREGQELRIELDGYKYAYQDVTIDLVADEVIGPKEARRLLDPGIADAVELPASVVIVRATLPGDTFEADGRTYRYHDGMVARAEARVRTERMISTLLPAVKGLSHDDDASEK